MVEMVEDKKDLGNVIALNSSMVNLARLLGPTAAGLLIAAMGEGACLLVRPIYVKMGIIPEIAMGIQSASELSIHRK